MLANLLNRHEGHLKWWALIYIPAWVVFSFGLSQLLVYVVVRILITIGAPLATLDEAVSQAILSVVIYALSLSIAIAVPWKFWHLKINRESLGLMRLPEWTDVLLAPVAFIIYGLVSASLLWAGRAIFPMVDWQQAQQVGFASLHTQAEYLLAFVTLVVIAPVAEEALFRGYLLGSLLTRVPIWAAVAATSLTFGLLHLGISLPLQWNVALDTFALSLILCLLRIATGNIWAGVLLHMIKNGIAYYVLFILPSLPHIIGG